ACAPTAGPDLDPLLGDYLSHTLQLLAHTTPCAVTARPRRLSAPSGRIAYEWDVGCVGDGPLQIRSALLLDVAPAHLHFARVTRDGTRPQERVLSDAERLWLLADAAPQARPL